MTDDSSTLPKSLTEAELAETLKAKAREVLGPVTDLLDEAKAQGLAIEFQLGQDFLGRSAISVISVVKRY